MIWEFFGLIIIIRENNLSSSVISETKTPEVNIKLESLMKLRLILLISIGLFVTSSVYSQDIHFTNYSYSPLYLSPAKTGSFLGSYRIGVNFREQFSSFIVEPFQTFMAYADMSIPIGFKSHHWIGAGLNVFTDKGGDLDFQNNGAELSLAYHFAIDPKYKTVITLGFQYGITRRSINTKNYRSEETLRLGTNSDADSERLQGFNPTIGDLNIGIAIKKWTSKKAYFDVGVSLYNLLQSTYAFEPIQGSLPIQNPVDTRLNVYGEYHIQTTNLLAIKPRVVYARMFNFQNLFGQFNLEYRLNKKSATILKGGIGYRADDAIQLLVGTIYKGWDIGISYDLTVSSAAQFTNSYGGIEIGIKKIFFSKKPPNIKPVILCPKL